MIKRTCWALLIFALVAGGAWLGEHMETSDSYFLLVFQGWSIETSAWVFLLANLLVVVGLMLIIKLLGFWRVHQSFGSWRARSKSNAAKKKTSEGLGMLARGRFKPAQKAFIKSAPNARIPALNYLLGALAAQAEGRDVDCDQALTMAETAEGSDPVLVGLLQAFVHMLRGSHEQALATLNRLEEDDRNPLYLEMLARVYQRLKDWDNLDSTIRKLEKIGRPGKLGSIQHQIELTLHRLEKAETTSEAKKVWQGLSKILREQTQVQLGYFQILAQLNDSKAAEQELQKAINAHYKSELIRVYGELNANPSQQLVVAELWLKERPNDAELLLALGRISMRNQLWGKAREYFEFSAKLNPSSLVHAELARFYSAMKDLEKSQRHFRKSVELMHTLPDLPVPTSNDVV